eukprot:GEMP01024554.1.p1 GENE.GEMP01024554.1~~GEMP01024554.1.p1  ORF type:complete len:696 (+),score=221.77 GEMP01024554.1:100-2187(+)
MMVHVAFLLALVCAQENSSPITRVVNLIQSLKERIGEDEHREELLWNRYSCWCENITKKKGDTIHETRDAINEAGRKILKNKAKAADAQHKINEQNQEIKDEQEAIASAVAIREKQRETYEKNMKETDENIDALNRAIDVLHKGAGISRESLMQLPEFSAVSKSISLAISSGKLNQRQLALAEAIVVPASMKGDDGSGSYAPQSMTVIGIVEDMRDQFKNDQKEWTAEEEKRQKQHDKLVETKNENIALLQGKVEKQTERKAKASENEAVAQQDHTALSEQLDHDAKFFDATENACGKKKERWDERQRLRHEELDGINEALKILTSEENRHLFNKAIKPGQETISFLQTSTPRLSAYQALRSHARATKSLRLAALAASVKMGNRLQDVVKSIDKMIKNLDAEERKDFRDREWCQETQHKRNEARKQFLYEARVAQDKADQALLEKKSAEQRKAESETEEREAKNTITQLTREREEENQNFKQGKSDDEQAVGLLQETIEHLSKFYRKNEIDAGKLEDMNLLEEPVFEVSEEQAPDATFSSAGHRKGESKGVISTLTMIKTDLQNEVKQSIENERENQEEYQSQVDDLNALIVNLNTEQVNLEGTIAARDATIQEQDTERDNRNQDAKSKQEAIDDDKVRCDHAVDNFEQRREKRRLEKEGLIAAKNFLASAPNVNLLQNPEVAFLSTSFRRIAPH